MNEEERALSALIVRNIGEMEAAVRFADERIDTRLWQEIANFLEEKPDIPGCYSRADGEDKEIYLSFDDWQTPDGDDEERDFWLSLEEYGESKKDCFSWLVKFLGVSSVSSSVGLIFRINEDIIKRAKLKRYLKDEAELVSSLEKAGFSYDGEGVFYIPVVLNADVISNAFQNDDFSTAFDNLYTAWQTVAAAEEPLQLLVNKIRAISA